MIANNQDVEAAREQRLKNQQEALWKKGLYSGSKKLTSGTMVAHGDYELNHKVFEAIQQHADAKAAAFANKQDRKRWHEINDVAKVWQKTEDRWTVAKLCTMCTYKKGTDKVPAPGAKKEALKLFYEDHKTTPSPAKPTVEQQSMPPLTGLEEEEVIDEIKEEPETGIIPVCLLW